MQRYARVTDGVVSNVCVGTNLPSPFIQCPDEVSIGWRHENGSFAPPVVTRVWTAYEFLSRFTAGERAAIRAGSASDAALADFLMLAQAAQEIQSDDPITASGMYYLTSIGIITEQRRSEIMGS